MDERTLTALRGSIEKWRKIVARTGTDKGSRNCALCIEFYTGSCDGCPVAERVNLLFCMGTPYPKWKAKAIRTRAGYSSNRDGRATAEAQAELDFLISLLPKGVNP